MGKFARHLSRFVFVEKVSVARRCRRRHRVRVCAPFSQPRVDYVIPNDYGG